MAIVPVGIELAKNVFAVHGVDETGKSALVRPELGLSPQGAGMNLTLAPFSAASRSRSACAACRLL